MGWDAIHLFQFDIRAVDYGSVGNCMPQLGYWALSDFVGFRKRDRFAYIYVWELFETRNPCRSYI